MTEDTHGRRVEEGSDFLPRVKPQPSRRKHPEDMTMRKKPPSPTDRIVQRPDRRGRQPARGFLPPGQPSLKSIQPGALAWICFGVSPSFFAPFNEVGIDFNLRAEAAELAGLSGAMKRARQDQRERRPF